MSDIDAADDDLPVLTDVLRVGRLTRHAFDPRRLDDVDRAEAARLAPDQLVVGHDAQARLEPYAATVTSPTSDALDIPSAIFAPLDAAAAPGPLDVHLFVGHDPGAAPLLAAHGADPADGARGSGQVSAHAVDRNAPASAASLAVGGGAAADRSAPATVDMLRETLRASVLADLATRIDSELDARVAHALNAEIEVALAQLQERLREQIASGLRDVVGRAVDQQIERWRADAPRQDGSG